MRSAFVYLGLVGLPILALIGVLSLGEQIPPPPDLGGFLNLDSDASVHGTILTLLLQVGVIIVAARIVGRLFRRIHQPQVMGEMVAGIMLGPSLLGWVAPGVFHFIFPEESLGILNGLSQIGLMVFMFLVGLELNPRLLRGRGQAVLLTSHASIVAPFLFGALLALFLYGKFSNSLVSFTEFALFIGAAMSVTAFPVLARILTERNLLRSKVGVITIACAAVDDVTAWCMLAAVVALVRAESMNDLLIFTLGGALLYLAFMIFAVRPALGKLETYYHTRGRITQDILALVLLIVLASAWATEWIGIHALFGAFLIGAVMPKEHGFVHDLNAKLEDFAVVLLLPLFFAYTGLQTKIGLLNSLDLWLICGVVTAVAIAGKLGGSAVAARLTGLSWRESTALGILMNTRGLMQLVILTVGLELGVISPALFAMLIVMALVTTFMTTPLLEWVYPSSLIRKETIGEEEDSREFTILIPVSLPSSGPELLRVAGALAESSKIYALHIARPEAGSVRTDAFPRDESSLQPLLEAAHETNVEVRPLAFVSRNPGNDIAEVARVKRADLVLMGWHKPILSQSILGGTVYDVMRQVEADVAVYLARRYGEWKRVLVPYTGTIHDRGALELARRLGSRHQLEITILHVVKPERGEGEPKLGLSDHRETLDSSGVRLKVVESHDFQETAVVEAREGYDLVIIGASEEWGLSPTLFARHHEELARSCPASLLIVRKHVQEEAARGEVATATRKIPVA